MGRTVTELTQQEREAYRRALSRLKEAEQARVRQRAEHALCLAREAAAILRQEFGVRRVWLFGSLARGTFGAGSDIDLAVDGIDEKVFLRALGRLLGLHPEFPVDLVDLREAPAGLRRAVESEGILLWRRTSRPWLDACGEELAEVSRVVERACELARRARATGDDGYWDAVALHLHGFYGGVERILEAIVREVDGSVPTGPHFHRDLLMQMSAELPGRRPAVISRDCRDCLEEYRAFRHLVRNVYTFSLRPQRLEELVRALPGCLEALKRDLAAFIAYLESAQTDPEGLAPDPTGV